MPLQDLVRQDRVEKATKPETQDAFPQVSVAGKSR